MKSNLTNSKDLSKKIALPIGYSSSYTDKYKKKTIKSSQYSKLFSQSRFPKDSNGASSSKQTQYKQLHSFEEKVSWSKQKSESAINDDQWMGQQPQNSEKDQLSTQKQQNRVKQAEKPVEQKIQSKFVKKPSNILIQDQIQEDLNIYQQYRNLQHEYMQQLEKIQEETQKIKRQCELEKSRIAESEQNLYQKKKKLKFLEDTYNLIVEKGHSEAKEQSEMIRKYQQKLSSLKQEYQERKKLNSSQKARLQNQITQAEKQNQILHKQLSSLQSQLQPYDAGDGESQTLEQLKSQQNDLLQTFSELQRKERILNEQLQQLTSQNSSKPDASEVHSKYLQIYEKMFITAQLYKAQEILRLKDQEKHEIQEIQKRKTMIKDKKIDVALKQKRIMEKNKLIDKLTQEIRQKSTTLLNLYQQQG